MSIKGIVVEVNKFFEEILHKQAQVIRVEPRENGWLIQVETVEDSEYMRRRALDDIMALYEVEMNEACEITSYRRISLRERDVIKPEEDEE